MQIVEKQEPEENGKMRAMDTLLSTNIKNGLPLTSVNVNGKKKRIPCYKNYH